MSGSRQGLCTGRASGLWEPARSTSWCSSTGNSPPSCISATGATHDELACWFGVDRSTITRAISEVRPLLAERGCSVSPGVRLQTLDPVVDHLG
ncbi:transposase family protein [Streptomyces echinatus]|uniref:Transposase Helix-turn-helix domain-containing protein n=1 Tax=Streptomyces echinatus TaxID=67293 RepID=A0A7W9Q1E7_9ACTN|nr:hypothetical protein [Streptomyces echinatus]